MQTSQAPFENACFSKPQLKGGWGGTYGTSKPLFSRAQRQRMNLVSIFQCLILPWVLYCLMYAVMSFRIHYMRPWLCYVCVGCGFVTVLVTAGLAARTAMKKLQPDQDRAPNWFIFLFLTMLIAWIAGIVLGDLNFWTNLQPYYDYTNLNEYTGVNPAQMTGQQLMDAGRIDFTNSSEIDLRRSMGFKNLDVYCVAPITIRGAGGTLLPLASYDFWAVGLGCCSGNAADFHCGHYNNPKAHSGLRLLHDEQRPFFRLAVQQAESAYAIKATHPLFFYWAEDPSTEMESFRDEGYKYYFLGMVIHFVWQILCVGLAAAGFSRLGQY